MEDSCTQWRNSLGATHLISLKKHLVSGPKTWSFTSNNVTERLNGHKMCALKSIFKRICPSLDPQTSLLLTHHKEKQFFSQGSLLFYVILLKWFGFKIHLSLFFTSADITWTSASIVMEPGNVKDCKTLYVFLLPAYRQQLAVEFIFHWSLIRVQVKAE